jgi:YD repeat-containing protein
MTGETDASLPGGTREFWYDALGRLVSATAEGAVQEYEYDRFGNRVAVRALGPLILCAPQPCTPVSPELPAEQHDGWRNLVVDPSTNHIVSPDFAYDAAGNLVSAPQLTGGRHKYQYDAAGRLARVTDAAGQLLERHAYSHGRQRVATFDAAGLGTVYGWSGNFVIAEYDAAPGSPLRWRRSLIRSGSQVLGSFSLEQGREVVDIHSNDRTGTRLVTRADPPYALAVALRRLLDSPTTRAALRPALTTRPTASMRQSWDASSKQILWERGCSI